LPVPAARRIGKSALARTIAVCDKHSGMRLPALLVVMVLAAPAARSELDPSLATGRLAVLDFRNKLADPREVDAGYCSDIARSAALKAVPGLRVITRENLIVLLQSTGRKIEECEGECEVD